MNRLNKKPIFDIFHLFALNETKNGYILEMFGGRIKLEISQSFVSLFAFMVSVITLVTMLLN